MFLLVAPQAQAELLARVWKDAELETAIKHDALAALMGIPASRLSDQLAGRASQHLSLQRVLVLATDPDGRRFLRCLCLKLATANGFDLDCELQIAMIQRIAMKAIDRLQQRMPVKAHLRETAAKEVA